MALLAKKLGLSDETVDLDDVVLWFHCQAKKRALKKFNGTLQGIRTSFKGILRCLKTLKALNYDQSMANNVKECVPRCTERLTDLCETQCNKFHSNCIVPLKEFLQQYYHIDTELKLKHREYGRDYQKLLRSNENADAAELQAKAAFDKAHLELKVCIRKFLYGQDCWETLVKMLREWKVQWASSDAELLDLAQKLSQAERLDRPKPPPKDNTCPYCTSLPAWERRFSSVARASNPTTHEIQNGDEEQVDVEGLQDNEFDPEFDQFDALVIPLMLEVRAMRDAFKQIPIMLKSFVLSHEALRADLESMKQKEDVGCEEMEMLPRPKVEASEFESFSGPSLDSRRPTLSHCTPRGSNEDLFLDFPEISRTTEDLQMNGNAANLIEFYEEIEQKAGKKIVTRKIPPKDENMRPQTSSTSTSVPISQSFSGLTFVVSDSSNSASPNPQNEERKVPLSVITDTSASTDSQIVIMPFDENVTFSPLPRSDSLSFWPQQTPISFDPQDLNVPKTSLSPPPPESEAKSSHGSCHSSSSNSTGVSTTQTTNHRQSHASRDLSLSHSFSDSALDGSQRRTRRHRSRPRSGSSPVKGSLHVHRAAQRTLSSSSLPLFTGKVRTLDFVDTYLQSLASSVSLLDDNDTSFVSELDEIISSVDVLNEIFEKAKRLRTQFQSYRKQFELKHLKETQEQEKARRELVQKNERLRALLLEKTKRSYMKELEALRKLRMKRKSDVGRRLSAQYRKTEEVRAQAQFKRIQRMEQLSNEIKKLNAEGSEANNDEPVDFNDQQLYALGPEVKDEENALDESFPKPIYSSSHAQLRQKVLELHQATSHVIHHMNYMLQLAPREIHRALIGMAVRLQTTISNMATATKLAYNQAQEFTTRRQTRASAALFVLLRGIGAESGELGDWEISSGSDDTDSELEQDPATKGELTAEEEALKHSVPFTRRRTHRNVKSPLKAKLAAYRLEKRTGVSCNNLVDVYCGFQPIRLLPHIARLERVLYGDAKAVHVRVVVNWGAGPLVYELDIVGLRRVRFVVSILKPRQLDIRSGGPDVERFIPVGKLCTNKVSKEQFREFAEQYLLEHANYSLFSENCRTYSDVLMLKAVTDQAVWGRSTPVSPLAFIHEQSKTLYSWIKKKRTGSGAHTLEEKKTNFS